MDVMGRARRGETGFPQYSSTQHSINPFSSPMWIVPRLIAWFALTVFVRCSSACRSRFPDHPALPGFPPRRRSRAAGRSLLRAGGRVGLARREPDRRPADGAVGRDLDFPRAGFFLLRAERAEDVEFFILVRGGPREAGAVPGATRRGSSFVSWPGCALAASWQGLGSELLRLYPFTYVASLLVLNNIMFCTLLGLPLYRLMAGLWVPRFGTWDEALGADAAAGLAVASQRHSSLRRAGWRPC